MSTKTTSRPGFTLIDAIAAIVIVSVAVPSLTWAIRDAQRARTSPVMLTRAHWLASERLDEVVADRHSPTSGYSYITTGNYPTQSPVPGFPGFVRTTSITETGPTLSGAGSGYKIVTVSVSCSLAGGPAAAIQLSTVLTDYTP